MLKSDSVAISMRSDVVTYKFVSLLLLDIENLFVRDIPATLTMCKYFGGIVVLWIDYVWLPSSWKSIRGSATVLLSEKMCIWSASAELRGNRNRFLDSEKTRTKSSVTFMRDVDRCMLWHPAQFEWTKTFTLEFDCAEKKTEFYVVSDMYRVTRLA